MYKISEIISMPIITLYESEYIGIVHNIKFDYHKKKCKYIYVLNEKNNLKQIINMSDIYRIGENCLFLKNKDCLKIEETHQLEMENCINPLNLAVYSTNGKYIGTSQDAILNNSMIEYILLNNGQKIKSGDIFNIGNNVILIHDKVKFSISKFKPRQKIINKASNQKVSILSTIAEPPKSQESTISTQNTKIITDVKFLIGRILHKDIIANNGEIVAKSGSLITKDMINKANNYGKLIEITRFSADKKISTF